MKDWDEVEFSARLLQVFSVAVTWIQPRPSHRYAKDLNLTIF
jgi:hypothetical protein